MAFTSKHVANDNSLRARPRARFAGPASVDNTTATKQLAALKVAQAAAGVEAALETLGLALREDAQLRVHDAMALMKRGLSDGEGRVEALLARVPGLGPWLAMEIFRVTHTHTQPDDLPIYPTNLEERSDGESVADYLDCIGFHTA
jgi:hypothetical protein